MMLSSILNNTQTAFAIIHFGDIFITFISKLLQDIGGLSLLYLHIYDSCYEVIKSTISAVLSVNESQ